MAVTQPKTLDEIRDWFARRQGWRTEPPQVDGLGDHRKYWWKWTISPSHGERTYAYFHPIPPTLDAIAGLMPPNVRTFKSLPTRDGNPVFYEAVNSEHLIIATVPDTGNELLDRARLAMLATLAEDKAQAGEGGGE